MVLASIKRNLNMKKTEFNSLVLEFLSPCKKYSVTFEDNGKVAYAYLKMGKDIIGDVWLYNRCNTPLKPEWNDKSEIPFANCNGYMSEAGKMQTTVADSDVLVDWEYEGQQPVCYVYIYEDLYGVIAPGDKPGFARFALKNGPIARVMEIE